MKKKIIIIAVISILLIFLIRIAYSDYANVAISYDEPRFCLINKSNSESFRKYIGLGYSFDIDGHLESNEKYKVDTYTYKILGIVIKAGEASPNKG